MVFFPNHAHLGCYFIFVTIAKCPCFDDDESHVLTIMIIDHRTQFQHFFSLPRVGGASSDKVNIGPTPLYQYVRYYIINP